MVQAEGSGQGQWGAVTHHLGLEKGQGPARRVWPSACVCMRAATTHRLTHSQVLEHTSHAHAVLHMHT